MAVPNSSLQLAAVTFDALTLIEQTQNVSVAADNTLVEAKGAADRYSNKVLTKQKQVIDWSGHWLNSNLSTPNEASNLSIGLWSLGGTAYIGQLKTGSLEITNAGPEVSGIAVINEFMVPTMTDASVTSGLMVVTQDAMSYLNMTAVDGGFGVTVAITYGKGGAHAGEAITLPGILRSTKQSVTRDGVQMEDVVISLSAGPSQTAPTCTFNAVAETASLIYCALIGGAISSATVDFGTNDYVTGVSQYAVITRLGFRFADKAVIEQSVTMEVQGALTVTEGS